MQKVICDSYEQMSKKAAQMIADAVKEKPELILGLPTGGTPVGMYAEISRMVQEKQADFSNVTTFNLDEYIGLPKDHEQSYYYFMNDNLYSKVPLKEGNVPNGMAENMDAECEAYDKRIADMGGLDIMVLGIGPNGHIGFNEPDSELIMPTHVVSITEATIDANQRFFSSRDEVPRTAVTMGIGSIMKAKKIILLASGMSKKQVVAQLLSEKAVTTQNPSTLLLVHPDVTVFVEKEIL